jgi:hypothetical protein
MLPASERLSTTSLIDDCDEQVSQLNLDELYYIGIIVAWGAAYVVDTCFLQRHRTTGRPEWQRKALPIRWLRADLYTAAGQPYRKAILVLLVAMFLFAYLAMVS